MRFNDDVIEEELYHCTAKAAEGCAAENALGFTKDDGMHIEMHWQDSDSSTASSLCDHFLIEENQNYAIWWSCGTLPCEQTLKIS